VITPKKPKFNFDVKRFLLRKGERVAFGLALTLMLAMVVASGLSLARGKGSAANTRLLNDLNSEARTKMATSKPTADVTSLPPDLLAALAANGADLIDPDLFACDQPFFSRQGLADRKWRRPKVLAPVEFTAEVMRGGIESYMFVMGDDRRPKEIAVLAQHDTRQDLNAALRMQGIFAKYQAGMAVGPGSLPGGGGGGGGAPRMMGRPGRGRGGMGSGGGGGSESSGGVAGGNGPDGSGSGSPGGGSSGRPQGRRGDLLNRTAFRREGDLKFISVDEFVQKPSGRRLARTVIPTRMAVISGCFPYRAQLEEYRWALHFDSIESMLNDPGASLEFLGMQVQRRTVTPLGESITDWEDLDIETPIKQLKLASTGSQKENEELLRYGIIVYPNRLVMPRPKLVRHESYPEERLRLLTKTIADLKKPDVVVLAQPPKASIFDREIDVWSDKPVIGGEADTVPAASGSPRAAQIPAPINGGGASGGRRRGARGRFSEDESPADEGAMTQPRGQAATRVPPEYCLFRFLDVTIEPGRSYEYRIKVEIANPSYGQPDRALTEAVAREPALVADEWTVVSRNPARGRGRLRGTIPDDLESSVGRTPGMAMRRGRSERDRGPLFATMPDALRSYVGQTPPEGMWKDRLGRAGGPLRVSVPDDLEFYAVDEAAGASAESQKRKAMEVHRWLDVVQVNPTDRASVMPVGAWSILPRIPVSRGEYIGRTVEMPVPVWKPTQNGFVFATPPEDEERQGAVKRTIRHSGVRVDFATEPLSETGAGPILVDFDGGKRAHPADPKAVLADTSWEVLVYTADNKLVLRNSATDSVDPGRTARVTEWEQWLKETANAMSGANGGRGPGGGRGRRPGGR
jgi:hypothetical protein